jgi:5'-methylthioadenosine phosphorylase
MVLGIIGGSGLLKSAQFLSLVKRGVATEHGSVIIREGTLELASSTCPALSVVFIQRHAADPSCEYSPPHLINYRAIMCALRDRGVTRVLAVCSVGALQEAIPMGALIVPDDYFCPADILAISDGASAHKIPEIDAGLRAQILADLQGAPEGNFEPVDGGVYVQSRGPRFETKAEIRWMAQQGSIIGMTGSHEATLSCEVGLPYAMLCMVDNYANGLVSGIELSLESFHAAQKANLARLENAINVVLAGFAKTEEAAVAKLLAKDGPASAATEKVCTRLVIERQLIQNCFG